MNSPESQNPKGEKFPAKAGARNLVRQPGSNPHGRHGRRARPEGKNHGSIWYIPLDIITMVY